MEEQELVESQSDEHVSWCEDLSDTEDIIARKSAYPLCNDILEEYGALFVSIYRNVMDKGLVERAIDFSYDTLLELFPE